MLEKLKEEVYRANMDLPKYGLVTFTWGNVKMCIRDRLYTGWTNCLARRMKAHNEGKAGAKYTRAKRPVKLVYYEGFATKEDLIFVAVKTKTHYKDHDYK